MLPPSTRVGKGYVGYDRINGHYQMFGWPPLTSQDKIDNILDFIERLFIPGGKSDNADNNVGSTMKNVQEYVIRQCNGKVMLTRPSLRTYTSWVYLLRDICLTYRGVVVVLWAYGRSAHCRMANMIVYIYRISHIYIYICICIYVLPLSTPLCHMRDWER